VSAGVAFPVIPESANDGPARSRERLAVGSQEGPFGENGRDCGSQLGAMSGGMGRTHCGNLALAGIHGVGFVYRPDSSFELILNSRSDYGVIGFKSEGAGRYTKDWAVVAQAFVSGPGVRP
jgi:hypothetical protein